MGEIEKRADSPVFYMARGLYEKNIPEPKTAVISFSSSRYGHGTRENTPKNGRKPKKVLDDTFWQNLSHELRRPEAVYYDVGGHGNHKNQKPALLFVYPAEKGKKKLVVAVDYVMKDYRSPVSKTKERLLTNMVNTGEVMETHFLEADKNLELVWKK